jgi:hypothetical protein
MQSSKQDSNPENSEESGSMKPTAISVVRGATGPRTQRGKQKSKGNALKHGVFSQVVLLNGERRIEFDSLLSGLRNDLEPVGTLEELLVEKLASLVWRHRRLIVAEGAEIRKGQEFLEWDERRRNEDEIFKFHTHELESRGLIRNKANPIVMETCLSLLTVLEALIEKRGFDEEIDEGFLTRVYGNTPSAGELDSLLDSYSRYLKIARSPGTIGEKSESKSPEECKNKFLEELNEKIEQLRAYQEEGDRIESSRMEVDSLGRNVPDAPQLDRLLRYETTLEKAFERTLNQLERLQRVRKGQALPPTLNVNVSS